MTFGIVTLFPEMFENFLNLGVVGRAFKNKRIKTYFANPRDYTEDNYKTIDDRPFGGGPGMLMMAEPLARAVEDLKSQMINKNKNQNISVWYLSPQGVQLTQDKLKKWVSGNFEFNQNNKIILVCGRYEGIDERFIENYIDFEVSIGDYILSGGELGAQVLIDAWARLTPGVLGDEQSAQQDSFENNLLDCPHYTRPSIWRGKAVPDVLKSGNHAKINSWRESQALKNTQKKRPDLI